MNIKFIETDSILIIGSGMAGMKAALEIKEKGVEPLIFSKSKAGIDGSTIQAEADISLDSSSCKKIFNLNGDEKDSFRYYFKDIVEAGMYLNSQELVKKHVNKAPEYLSDLKNMGLKVNGLLQTPGHSYPRGISTTGEEIVRVLKKELIKENLNIKENHMMLDIVVIDNKGHGVIFLNLNEGCISFYRGKAVVLATGGAASLYFQSTNPPGLTGDGMAAAYRAGAKLQDMEFPMFLPFTAIKPEILKGMSFFHDLCVNLNAHLLNKRGERYIEKWDPKRKEKTTRDINSIAAELEIKNGNGSPDDGVYMSFKHLPDNLIEYSSKWLPESIKNWTYGSFNYKELSVDIKKEAFEVKPACHFWNGGVTIDKKTSTNIEGLFACGEVTGGLHGSNRISGNALTEALIWGGEAGKYSADYVNENNNKKYSKDDIFEKLENRLNVIYSPLQNKDGYSPLIVRKKLQTLAENYLRPVRSDEEYNKALTENKEIEEMIYSQATVNKRKIYNKEWQIALENHNLYLIIKMLIKAGQMRKESRGAHYRTDYPKTDNKNWLFNIVIKDGRNNKMILERKKPILKYFNPSSEVFDYGKENT